LAGDTQHNENLALAVRCIGLVSCASINQQGWLRKNNPNKMFSNLMPPPTANEKPTPQVGTMRKRNQRLLHWLSQLGKPTTSPADQAFTHGAILFFLSQSPQDTIRRGNYFLCNNVEQKITERRFVATFTSSPLLHTQYRFHYRSYLRKLSGKNPPYLPNTTETLWLLLASTIHGQVAVVILA